MQSLVCPDRRWAPGPRDRDGLMEANDEVSATEMRSSEGKDVIRVRALLRSPIRGFWCWIRASHEVRSGSPDPSDGCLVETVRFESADAAKDGTDACPPALGAPEDNHDQLARGTAEHGAAESAPLIAGSRQAKPVPTFDELENVRFAFSGSDEGGAGSMQMKSFPVALVERLRSEVAAVTTESFAAHMSGGALVTAFCTVQLGLEDTEYDAKTVAAVRAFRGLDQRTGAVEDLLGRLDSRTESMAKSLRNSGSRIDEVLSALYRLEFMTVFLTSERLLTESGNQPGLEGIEQDITEQPLVRLRDRIRKTTDSKRLEELRRAERSRRR